MLCRNLFHYVNREIVRAMEWKTERMMKILVLYMRALVLLEIKRWLNLLHLETFLYLDMYAC